MKQLIMAAGLAVMLTACGTSEKKTVEGENPFFAEYTTPFGVPRITDSPSVLMTGYTAQRIFLSV